MDRLALAVDACLDGGSWLHAREEADTAHARPFASLPQHLPGQPSATSLCDTVNHSLLFVSCVSFTAFTALLPLCPLGLLQADLTFELVLQSLPQLHAEIYICSAGLLKSGEHAVFRDFLTLS